MSYTGTTRAPAARAWRGFTLIEILVVLVIIGLIAGLVGPRLFSRVDKSRADTAQTQVEMLRGSLETYRLDVGTFPTEDQGLDVLFSRPADEDLANRWDGPYLDEPPPDDPWGRPYQYARETSENGLPFVLYSYGADGERGGEGVDADVGILPAD